jgi:alanine racemase
MERLPYRSWVEVSRKQVGDNFEAIRQLVEPLTEVMPVVKADAYRHGAIEVSRVLEERGARWLAVSNTEEGVALRDAGITARILVMADFLPFTREAMLAYGLTPVIHSLDDIVELDRIARLRENKYKFHLKVDTGMGRLGVKPDPAAILSTLDDCPNVELEGLMTHFASAGNYQSCQTDSQVSTFESVVDALARAGVKPAYLHLSSTIPIAYARKRAWRAMVRPGHAIYGYVSPARGSAPPKQLVVKPALAWKASVLQVKTVDAGSLIGYGGIYRAASSMRIAILAAGYADGIPHRLSNRGRVIVNGKFSPILGAVSMDLTTIDVTHSPEVRVGDAVTLLGSEGEASIDAQEMAKLAGTISYSVLCGIHARVKRLYL